MPLSLGLPFLSKQSSGRIPDSHNHHLSRHSADTFGFSGYVLSASYQIWSYDVTWKYLRFSTPQIAANQSSLNNNNFRLCSNTHHFALISPSFVHSCCYIATCTVVIKRMTQTTSMMHYYQSIAKLLRHNTYISTSMTLEGKLVAETLTHSVRRLFCEFLCSVALFFIWTVFDCLILRIQLQLNSETFWNENNWTYFQLWYMSLTRQECWSQGVLLADSISCLLQ